MRAADRIKELRRLFLTPIPSPDPVQADEHFLTVCRYVERNAVRANLVAAAEAWRWGSAWEKSTRTPALTLDEWPVPPPRDWQELVNRPQTDAEMQALRRALVRGAPYGDPEWRRRTARELSLESTLRPRGRPRRRVSSSL